MTTINDVSTNDMNFKHLDTTKNIVITPKNEFGGQVLLNTAHTWTAKVSDETNYIGNYPVTFESNSIVVNSAEFTKLPAGNYHLEVWEEWTDANGNNQRSIYPSPKETIPFRIYSNVTDLAEKEIKEIGFQDVVDQAVMNIGMNYVFKVNVIEPDQTATVVQSAADGKNYVTFNIPKGDKGDKGDVGPIGPKGDKGDTGATGPKGDTGTVDNAGLAAAPAFVKLQTQVNNSAVGTNLLKNTGDISANWELGWGYPIITVDTSQKPAILHYPTKTITSGSNTIANQQLNDGLLQPSTAYTASFYAKGTGTMLFYCYPSVSNGGVPDNRTNITLTSDYKLYTITFTTFPNISGNKTFLLRQEYSSSETDQNTVEAYVYGFKLEKGSVATDWCPNPSDILTKSDYAKIQAAIIALGGSLK